MTKSLALAIVVLLVPLTAIGMHIVSTGMGRTMPFELCFLVSVFGYTMGCIIASRSA